MTIKCKVCGKPARFGKSHGLCGNCYQNEYNNRRRAKGLLSHQREWQIKQIAMGLCQTCRQPRNHYAAFCDSCAELVREQKRGRLKGLFYSKTYAEGRKQHEHRQSS